MTVSVGLANYRLSACMLESPLSKDWSEGMLEKINAL